MHVSGSHHAKHHVPVQPAAPVAPVKPKAEHHDDPPKKVKSSPPPGVGTKVDVHA